MHPARALQHRCREVDAGPAAREALEPHARPLVAGPPSQMRAMLRPSDGRADGVNPLLTSGDSYSTPVRERADSIDAAAAAAATVTTPRRPSGSGRVLALPPFLLAECAMRAPCADPLRRSLARMPVLTPHVGRRGSSRRRNRSSVVVEACNQGFKRCACAHASRPWPRPPARARLLRCPLAADACECCRSLVAAAAALGRRGVAGRRAEWATTLPGSQS